MEAATLASVRSFERCKVSQQATLQSQNKPLTPKGLEMPRALIYRLRTGPRAGVKQEDLAAWTNSRAKGH